MSVESLSRKKFDGKYSPSGGTLVLVRHGTSEGNSGGRWTGRKDVPLAAPKGFEDAVKVAQYLREYNVVTFDAAYTSRLQRARVTTRVIEQELIGGTDGPLREIPTVSTSDFDERDFGIYTWWTRKEVMEQVGEEEFVRLRRGWDARIEGGESMEDVSNRVRPRLRDEIVPRVVAGEKVLLVAHSNVVRVALAELHELPPGETHETVVVNNGEAHVLEFNKSGIIVDHEVLRQHSIERAILDHEAHAS